MEHRHDPSGEHTSHTAHATKGAGQHTAHHSPATWRMAAMATLHCLTGCAIGEILGMVIGTALG
jgi:hypothetical protein